MNKIYVVRHGETDWNKNGICQGKTNISLNENGYRSILIYLPEIKVANSPDNNLEFEPVM